MKKLLVLLVALTLSCLLISCGDEGVNSSISTESHDVSSTQSSQIGESVDVPTSSGSEDKVDVPPIDPPNEESELFATFEENSIEYYQTLACGEYFGNAFDGAEGRSCYYSVIKTYKELCATTERGSDYKEEIFENNYVLVIYRPYNYVEINSFIGYRGFTVSRGNVFIERHYHDGDFVESIRAEGVDLQYVLVPQKAIDLYDEKVEEAIPEYSVPASGKLNISSQAVYIYDTAFCRTGTNTGYKDGQAWIIEPSELNQFLSDNGITASWNRTCDCQCDYYHCSTAYKILIIYRDATGTGVGLYNSPFGYNFAYADGDTLSIIRHSKTSATGYLNIEGFELVAIPNSAFVSDYKDITNINIESIGHVITSPERNDVDLSNLANVEQKSYSYYEFLDLGIYYYYDKLPSGDAYHIITSHEELKKYVSNPFVSAKEMENNYVIAIKIDGYEYERLENIIYGIRELGFDKNGVLCATTDVGYCRNDDEAEVINHYPDNVLYIIVPKTELDIEGKALARNMRLTKVEDEDAYRHSFTGISKSYFTQNQVWMVGTYAKKDSLESSLYVDFDSYITTLGNGELYLVFYGKLRSNPRFYNFRIDGKNMYIDIVEDAGKEEPKGYFYVVKLDNIIDYSEDKTYKMNITRYTREPASIRRGEYLTESLYSYVLSNDADVGLPKEPDFEWKLIDNYDTLSEIFAEYGGIYPNAQLKSIDFETAYILAHYTVESCIECHSAASFENVRYGNGCLYVDKYYDNHGGGEAESPCLYFVVIPKEYVTGEVTNVAVLQKNTYAKSEHKRVNSEYTAHVIDNLKELPEFDFVIIESREQLEELYREYAYTKALDALLNLDFEKMCIVAYVRQYDNSLVLGGFRNMRVENNKIFIDKYIEAKGSLESNDAMYTVLHLVAVEKTFAPDEINEVVDICEIDWK